MSKKYFFNASVGEKIITCYALSFVLIAVFSMSCLLAVKSISKTSERMVDFYENSRLLMEARNAFFKEAIAAGDVFLFDKNEYVAEFHEHGEYVGSSMEALIGRNPVYKDQLGPLKEAHAEYASILQAAAAKRKAGNRADAVRLQQTEIDPAETRVKEAFSRVFVLHEEQIIAIRLEAAQSAHLRNVLPFVSSLLKNTELVDREGQGLEKALAVEGVFWQQVVSLTKFFLTENKSHFDDFYKLDREFREQLKNGEAFAQTPEEKDVMRKIGPKYEQFSAQFGVAAKLLRNGDFKRVRKIELEVIDPAEGDLEGAIEPYYPMKVEDIQNAITRIREANQFMLNSTRSFLVYLALVMLLNLILAIGVIRSIVSPLQSLVRVTKDLANGNLRARAEVFSEDEVGQLAVAFNRMAESLESNSDKLEQRVRERTAEVQQALEKLEKAKNQLVQSEKMSAVGQLAGGVAHEINNPLGVILGFAQIVVRKCDPTSPIFTSLKSIEREAIRCKNLVQDLLQFSRASRDDHFEPIDVNAAILNSLSLIEARAGTKDVVIVKDLANDLPQVRANKNQLQQVVINLANNAVDAMRDGGKLQISTRRSVGGKGKVDIVVKDNGAGIPLEIRNKIFEPFFTTKEIGKGTGLGLSLVYEIVKKHNGALDLVSDVGNGTTFTVSLPEAVQVEQKAA